MGGMEVGVKAVLRIAYSNPNSTFLGDLRGGFHKPIYSLPQALTLCPVLLRLKNLPKTLEYSVKLLCAQLLAFMKSTQGHIFLAV